MRSAIVRVYASFRARWRETSLVFVGVIALFSAVFAAFDLMQALKNGEMVYSVSVSGLSIEGELQGYTQESRRVLLYALTTTDPNLQLPYVKAARVADAEVTRLHQRFAQIALSQSAKTLLATLRADWARYENVRNEIIGLILEDRTADALLLEKTQAGPLFDTCASRLRELKLMLDQFAKHQLVEIRGTYYRCAAEVVFLILTMLLFIVSVRMLSALRRNNLHLSQAEILERHRSRILESINQNTDLAQIFSDIAGLVEQSLSTGFKARILTSQAAGLPGVRVLHLPVPGKRGDSSGTLEVYAPRQLSLRQSDWRFCERAAQLASLAIEHHRVAGRLAFQAGHDELTGLANRVTFQERLLQSLGNTESGESAFALLWIDLDRFKLVNDMFGHHAGDSLLLQTAGRLGGCIGARDTAARIGGDEFVILLSGCSGPEAAAQVAGCVLGQLNKPVMAGGHELSVGASIGISLFPEHGADPETLLRNADTAMYRAKSQGKNMYQIYDSKMGFETSENLEIDLQLRTALEAGEFELHYQPQCSSTGAIRGAEALLRWTNTRLGSVPPSRFIPIAEESGVIVPLGAWVLRQACLQASCWLREEYSELRVAVNVSAQQFIRTDFASVVSSALRESGLSPERLELELTESTLMNNLEKTVRQMSTLRDLGVTIVIDDFGTGASSLSYLTQLPIDGLKIDRSFVNSINAPARGTLPLIRAIVGMAKGLRLQVVAEGVESQDQLAMLEIEGCDLFQGYHFHKPVTAARFTELLRSTSPPNQSVRHAIAAL